MRMKKKKRPDLSSKSGISIMVSFMKRMGKMGYQKGEYREIVTRVFDVMDMEDEGQIEGMLRVVQALETVKDVQSLLYKIEENN